MFSLKLPVVAIIAALTPMAGMAANASSDSASDDILSTIASAQARGECVVTLAPGRHKLPPQGLKLEKLRHLTIEGNGATLVAGSRDVSAIRIEDCEAVTLCNFQIDYDPLPFTQGDVVAVDRQGQTIEVSLHAGYPGAEAAVARSGMFTDARLQLFCKEIATHKPGAPDFHVSNLETKEGRTVLVMLKDQQAGLAKIEPGDRVTLSSRAAEGVSIRYSRDIHLEGVSVLAAPNVAIVVRNCQTAGTYRGVRVVPGLAPDGASQPRLMSACSDGLNIADARVGPVIEECEFAFQGDDAVNLHTGLMPLLRRLDEKTFLVGMPWKAQRMEAVPSKGDTVRFLSRPAYAVAGEARLESFARVTEPAEPWLPEIRAIWKMLKVEPARVSFFRVALENCPAGVDAGMFMDIPVLGAQGFMIRNSYFHDHRGRGLRIMASNGVVQDNTFERITGCAMSFGPEYAFWREAGWCRNVIVSGNSIEDVGKGMNCLLPNGYTSYTPAAISIVGHADDETSAFQGNEAITIEHNTIARCAIGGISVGNARNVQVRWNRITDVLRGLAALPENRRKAAPQTPISVKDSDAVVSDNQLP